MPYRQLTWTVSPAGSDQSGVERSVGAGAFPGHGDGIVHLGQGRGTTSAVLSAHDKHASVRKCRSRVASAGSRHAGNRVPLLGCWIEYLRGCEARWAEERPRPLTGKAAARRLARARILLKADEAVGTPILTDGEVAAAVEVSVPTVERTRKLFVEAGLERALAGRERTTAPLTKLDGTAEAQLIALHCSTPPDGRKRWTLRFLAARMVELQYVDDISYETVPRTLKKMSSSPGGASNGASPPTRTPSSSPPWKPS